MNKSEFLYHYTNFEGLKGIIDSKSLWLTNRKHMSDTSEFMHSKLLIEKRITKALSASRYKNVSDEYRKRLWGMFDDLTDNAYLFSFCNHKDSEILDNGLLTMWRGYGKDEGYAIVFKFEEMKKYVSAYLNLNDLLGEFLSSHIFEHVTYMEYSQNGKPFPNYLTRQLSVFESYLERYFQSDEDVTNEEATAIVSLMALIKHPGFCEEDEYRLCIIPVSTTELARFKLRKNSSSIISYIELPIKPKQLIQKIIIGPQRDIETKRKILEGYLREQGLTKIEVKASKIPYLSP